MKCRILKVFEFTNERISVDCILWQRWALQLFYANLFRVQSRTIVQEMQLQIQHANSIEDWNCNDWPIEDASLQKSAASWSEARQYVHRIWGYRSNFFDWFWSSQVLQGFIGQTHSTNGEEGNYRDCTLCQSHGSLRSIIETYF